MDDTGHPRFAGSPAVPLAELARRLGRPLDGAFHAAARRSPVRFPRGYAALIDPDDPADPILRIGWPDPEELRPDPGALADPVGEAEQRVHRLLIRKYPDRALLLVTARCHFYCRYCFRTAGRGEPAPEEIAEALDALARLPDVRELILSGGDPLVLPDGELERVLTRLRAIGSLRALRLHTRAPVHDPARITPNLAQLLASARPLMRVVLHAVHPRELTAEVDRAVGRQRAAGLPLLSQSVLLRGVNDDPRILIELFRRLYELGVQPYYLHHPDRVAGTARFRLPIEEGRRIVRALRGRLPGPAIPTYVLDLPDGSGKVPVDWLEPAGQGVWRVERTGRGASLYREPDGERTRSGGRPIRPPHLHPAAQ